MIEIILFLLIIQSRKKIDIINGYSNEINLQKPLKKQNYIPDSMDSVFIMQPEAEYWKSLNVLILTPCFHSSSYAVFLVLP